MTIKEGGFFSSTPYGGPNEGGNFFLSKPYGYRKFGLHIQGSKAPEWTHNIHCAIGTSNRLELIKQYENNGNAFADTNSSGVCFGHAVVCAESDANSDIAESLERCESVYTTTQQREPWTPGLNSPRGCYLDANDRPILPAWQNAQGGYHPVSRQGPHLMTAKQDGSFQTQHWPTYNNDGSPSFNPYGTGVGFGIRVVAPYGEGGFLEVLEGFAGDTIRAIEGDPFGRPMGQWELHCEFDQATASWVTRNGCRLEVGISNLGSSTARKGVDKLNELVTPPVPRIQKKPPGTTGPNIPDTITYETILLGDGQWYVVTRTVSGDGTVTYTNGPIITNPTNGPFASPGGLPGLNGGNYAPIDFDWGGMGGGIPGGFGSPNAPSNGGGNEGGPGGPGVGDGGWNPNPSGGNNGFGGEFAPPPGNPDAGNPDAPGGSGLVQTTHPRWPAPLTQDSPPYRYLQPSSINSKSLNAWFTDNNNKLTQRSKGSLPYALSSWDSVYWPNPKNPDPTKTWDTHHMMTGQNVPVWAKLDLNLDITAESPTKNTLPIDNKTNLRFPNHWVTTNTETSSNAVSFPRNTNGLNLSIEQSRSLKATPHKAFFVPSYVDVTSTVYKTIPTKSTWPLDILSYVPVRTTVSTANPSVSI